MTAPLRRRGPRPLSLHLGLAGIRAMAAAGALPGMPWPNGSPPWNGAWPISKAGQAEAARISAALASAGHAPEAFRGAVLNRLLRADRALVAGLAAYRRHPFQRNATPMPAIWAEEDSKLLDYGGQGPSVVFVPSLVNRAYVLDLMPEASLLRWLPGQGFRTLLLDWGWPGSAERHFTLTDYIAGRLERALMAAPGPVILAGYCMGGLLGLALALRRPDLVRGLALLATPWDFHAGPEGEALNDGVPLAAPVARQCIGGWYGRNEPASLAWRVAGQVVDPALWQGPAFAAIPHRDRIVPPASALALTGRLRQVKLHMAPAGHIGMVAGIAAETALWQPLRDWMSGL